MHIEKMAKCNPEPKLEKDNPHKGSTYLVDEVSSKVSPPVMR